jgi:hypothetical protein
VTTLNFSRLNDIMDCANIDSDGVRTDYSGRAMYGSECLGIEMSVEDVPMFFAAVGYVQGVAEAEEEGYEEDLMKLVGAARTDSMGRDVIVYFPGWTLSE